MITPDRIKNETLAQNLALLACAAQLGSAVVNQVAGTESVGNSFQGQLTQPTDYMTSMLESIGRTLTPYLES